MSPSLLYRFFFLPSLPILTLFLVFFLLSLLSCSSFFFLLLALQSRVRHNRAFKFLKDQPEGGSLKIRLADSILFHTGPYPWEVDKRLRCHVTSRCGEIALLLCRLLTQLTGVRTRSDCCACTCHDENCRRSFMKLNCICVGREETYIESRRNATEQ